MTNRTDLKRSAADAAKSAMEEGRLIEWVQSLSPVQLEGLITVTGYASKLLMHVLPATSEEVVQRTGLSPLHTGLGIALGQMEGRIAAELDAAGRWTAARSRPARAS